jgi:hypothetical protein
MIEHSRIRIPLEAALVRRSCHCRSNSRNSSRRPCLDKKTKKTNQAVLVLLLPSQELAREMEALLLSKG